LKKSLITANWAADLSIFRKKLYTVARKHVCRDSVTELSQAEAEFWTSSKPFVMSQTREEWLSLFDYLVGTGQ
jgi:hypothetical protein